MARKRVKFTTSSGERVSFMANPTKRRKSRRKARKGTKRVRVTFKSGGKRVSFMARR